MQILESPLLKNRIALGCIGLLGLSTFSGLIHTSVSSGFSEQLSQLFSRFGARDTVAQAGPTGTEGKISPIQWVTEQSKEAWSGYITPFVKNAYAWAKDKDKRNSVWGVLKQFWNYKFFKGVISNSPWIIAGWMSIIADGQARSKLALAWKYSLGFFDHVTKNTGLKDFSSYFGSIFAELLFMPARAIKNFKEREQLKTQQDPCSNPSSFRKEGETSICISVRSKLAEE
ncbi:hypothetical protein WEN_01430 [Mycoplasma wenyonii str. Massachusetts]|uniref:Uncharacterized protein n=1 Tax=Mycoplasma wenyonii (strain Massachusetts) TaxID=1197325 RepID=I6YAT9_MYCWM|nr:hypothetical protein [Mycoplasma wenyonii]AFN65081.1 hypothetical protein WEN_01430 [Mycoplasma wenyonii str. Massachusetts]